MTYQVKEVFYTLQGEGFHAGTPAVFCRFARCNLWSGKEKDRDKALCKFCDTDFRGGRLYESAEELARDIKTLWPGRGDAFVVLTGGEPALFWDAELAEHLSGSYVAIETNGTVELAEPVDWLCVSPKAGTKLKLTAGDELKLVYPQDGATPQQYEDMSFSRLSLQPMDGSPESVGAALQYCLAHPQWRLSLQTHKLLGIR
jgi:7-carboxy-7-deazaguanine synthase